MRKHKPSKDLVSSDYRHQESFQILLQIFLNLQDARRRKDISNSGLDVFQVKWFSNMAGENKYEQFYHVGHRQNYYITYYSHVLNWWSTAWIRGGKKTTITSNRIFHNEFFISFFPGKYSCLNLMNITEH